MREHSEDVGREGNEKIYFGELPLIFDIRNNRKPTFEKTNALP
jgi:hypothetical protein